MKLPEELRGEAIKRLAQLRQFSPEMAQRVAEVLHKRLEALGEQSRRAYSGLRGVADLMNRLDVATGKTILEAIEKEDPKLALSIRNLMFTFEDLLTVPESGIRDLLGQMDKKTLATALRGASEELKNYIFKSMSSRAVEMLKEDMGRAASGSSLRTGASPAAGAHQRQLPPQRGRSRGSSAISHDRRPGRVECTQPYGEQRSIHAPDSRPSASGIGGARGRDRHVAEGC